MYDLISRQAAIDALKRHFSDDGNTDTEYGAYWHHRHVLGVIDELPSAEISPCDVCAYGDDCEDMRIYCPAIPLDRQPERSE